jgi:hypothetical protein
MSVTSHFYMVIGDLPPRARDLLRHLSRQGQPFSLNDSVLPPGGLSAWAGAFQLLWTADVLERVGWGQSPRFQLKSSARRALGAVSLSTS